MAWKKGSGRGYMLASASAVMMASLFATTSAAPNQAVAASAQGATAAKSGKSIGFAITSWRYGLVETPEYKECEGGKVDPGPVEQMRATPGAIDRLKSEGGFFEAYGPNGETPQNSPLLFNEPLKVPELIEKTGYGVNLDGTPDGRATARTCKHEKFAGIGLTAGENIDNQLSRVFGCVQGYRTGGQTAEFYVTEVQTFAVNRHLMEVTGVDSEINDPSVTVYFYKGIDRLVRTGDGNWVPNLSQRIDVRYPQYNMKTTGRIVNGVLITDPIKNALMPHSSQRKINDREMHDMTVRLKLTPDGGEGILAGYDNWQHLWRTHSKRVTHELNKTSNGTLYRRLVQYADGYPGPDGKCTHISSAYKISAVRSTIVHIDKPAQRIARN